MYCVNGVDLSSAEFELLAKLVDERSPTRGAVEAPDDAVYRSLFDKGLIRGTKVWGAFLYDGPTIDGTSYVKDWNATSEAKRKAAKSDRRHDYLVASFSAALGFGLGILSSYLTNCFGLLG